uniref:Alpha/beta fold hydrolase n=1 Tax=Phenylobacterium glaciei TaxID=2803784 RepID=A0A974P5P4_9CAUL|nr:alpha/beta fold hydrolase [Phenylobacterium glaciei]
MAAAAPGPGPDGDWRGGGGAGRALRRRRTAGCALQRRRRNGTQRPSLRAQDGDPATPAPAILAVHGYINTRETQSAFAIEFARRGYVVLALDQRGHGYSGGAATTKGFGGPEGLAYLRSLAMVDPDQIGLEGHSMGGWTVLAAAAAMPDGYRSMVLEGSSVGRPSRGTARPPGLGTWRWCSAAMTSSRPSCGVCVGGGHRRQRQAARHLRDRPACDDRQGLWRYRRGYGARSLQSARDPSRRPYLHRRRRPRRRLVRAHATGGRPLSASDQVWWWKEGATGVALIGVFVFLLGTFGVLLALPPFAALRGAPVESSDPADLRWWSLLGLTSLVPPITFFLINFTNPPLLPVSAAFPADHQLADDLGAGQCRPGPGAGRDPRRRPAEARKPWGLAALLAVATAAIVYGAVAVAGLALVDFRFWVVALKPLSASQALAALAYLPAFTLFTCVSFRDSPACSAAVRPGRSTASPSAGWRWASSS